MLACVAECEYLPLSGSMGRDALVILTIPPTDSGTSVPHEWTTESCFSLWHSFPSHEHTVMSYNEAIVHAYPHPHCTLHPSPSLPSPLPPPFPSQADLKAYTQLQRHVQKKATREYFEQREVVGLSEVNPHLNVVR